MYMFVCRQDGGDSRGADNGPREGAGHEHGGAGHPVLHPHAPRLLPAARQFAPAYRALPAPGQHGC